MQVSVQGQVAKGWWVWAHQQLGCLGTVGLAMPVEQLIQGCQVQMLGKALEQLGKCWMESVWQWEILMDLGLWGL